LQTSHALAGAAHDAPSAIFDGDWLIDVFFKTACVTRENVLDLHNICKEFSRSSRQFHTWPM